MEDLQVKVIDALREGTIYDFIANNYYEMDKQDLKDILLEIAYAFYNKNGVIAYEEMQKQVAQTLEEYWQE